MSEHENDLVCVVDDDESLRRSIRNLLSSVGFSVETFDSAEAFLGSDHYQSACRLVLDLRMPGMGGLGLLDHLAAIGSPHPTIVLTGHGDDETRRRAFGAGAVAFLEKPFQSDALLDALEHATVELAPAWSTALRAQAQAMAHVWDSVVGKASDRPVRVAGGTLGSQRHICAFFNGAAEERRALRSFVKDGIDDGDKCFHIVGPGERDDHLDWLRDEGIDVDRTMATGQLDVRPWNEAYLRGDHFDQDAMLALVDNVLQSNAAAGYPLTRILAHMEWALLDKPGVDDLIEYEARANHILPKYGAPVICAYDLSRFSASIVMDVLRTHPMVIVGGAVQENPFFVPPDEFLRELRMRRSTPQHAGFAI